ncbi:hypothetical protein J4457_04975 [Candidatus Woesearchaeota archaeon]|nr:hypothetical protein [Candidatus Woesearchaeota archaeon]
MTIVLEKLLTQALEDIGFGNGGEHVIYQLHLEEVNLREMPPPYQAQLKNRAFDLMMNEIPGRLNRKFEGQLIRPFGARELDGKDPSLYKILFETYCNATFWSEYHSPFSMRLWTGESGFIVAVAQLGQGFNAIDIDRSKKIQNAGCGFDMFRTQQGYEVFFDNPVDARTVYVMHRMSNPLEGPSEDVLATIEMFKKLRQPTQ